MVERPGMWAGTLSLFRVGTVAGLMRISPMVGPEPAECRVDAGSGKRLEYRKGANESTREPAHNIEACAELLWRGDLSPLGCAAALKPDDSVRQAKLS